MSGLVREVVLNGFLGTTRVADAFRAALQMPGLLQNVLGEGVLSASFIPVYAELVEEGDEEEAGRVAGAVAGLLGALTFVVVVVGVLLARPIAWVLLPALPDETFDLTVDLARIMWAGLGFIVLSAWCLGVLNTHRRFFLSYIAPVLWNAGQVVLASFAWLSDWSEADIARAAAWGVVLGGFLQFIVQVPTVRRVAPSIRLSLQRRRAGVRQVISRFGPAVLGRGVVQVSAFLDLFLAGLLATGALVAVNASQVLYLMPIGVFALSVAAADLPEMARERRNEPRVVSRLRSGLERSNFFVAFCAVAFIACGKPLVGALFQRGEFTEQDTILVWLVLAAYSLGLVASATSRVMQNALYARGDVKGPAKLAFVRVLVAAAAGFVLMLQFDRLGVVGQSLERLGDIPATWILPEDIRGIEDSAKRLGAVGLALGSALAAWLEYFLLRRRFRREMARMRPLTNPLPGLVPAALVAFVSGAAISCFLDGLPPLLVAPIAIGVSGALYVVMAHQRGVKPAGELLRAARLLPPDH